MAPGRAHCDKTFEKGNDVFHVDGNNDDQMQTAPLCLKV